MNPYLGKCFRIVCLNFCKQVSQKGILLKNEPVYELDVVILNIMNNSYHERNLEDFYSL